MRITSILLGTATALALGSAAHASTLDIPFSIGSGNSNEKFTIDRNNDAGNDIEIGIKAKKRFVGDITPVGNVYNAQAGDSDPGLAIWNIDWSVDLGAGKTIDDYDVYLTVDFNTAAGNSDVSTFLLDGTPFLEAGQQINQQSQNLGFGFWAVLPNYQPFDPFAPGEYEIGLTVFDQGATTGALARAQAFVNVAPIPLPPSLALGALGLGALAFAGRRARRKPA
ncbi:hypothetical protein PVW48_00570 [Dinoroseobacter sp. PD6]|uniref:hypothetical protein n=1 Tax=Dinoroseobacter sp. PD6 TaxID=3028384 RepID=UPI00237C06C1|nr:hypothetical protein [Dinoroseobacter sp. PD6]MDD9715227.1 hypothetical protein [Dinoroseobacter sp. PD6]